MSEQFPAVASSLLVDGKVLSHTSLVGDGRPNLHPAVWEFAGALSQRQRKSFTGRCAESALISDQLWALDAVRSDGRSTTLREAAQHFEGSAIISRKVRGQGHPEHGKVTDPCSVCSALLQELGVRVMR
ncbi:YwqJ-related putative deaminase [Streptomyces niger]|uniref:YwqJ-related putative deaminase n=1 Tax=Streptomyces niger TaxID=66373 RepID=UPI001F1EFD25|nr:YwqJ-related putative deaminase [Streptomyces niger]